MDPQSFNDVSGHCIYGLSFVGGLETRAHKKQKRTFWKPFLLLGIWWIVEGVIPFVLNHTSLTIGLDNLFELQPYSYVLIALFVLLFLSYNVLFRTIFMSLLRDTQGRAVVLMFLLCVVFFMLELFYS